MCVVARGRPKKTAEESSDSQKSETSVTESEEEAKINDEAKSDAETTENSHDDKEESANNNAESSKVSTTFTFYFGNICI